MMFKVAVLLLLMPATSSAANFRVFCRDTQFGTAVISAADEYREELSYDWFGRRMPEWPQPCIVHVEISDREAGSTTYSMRNGVPVGLEMYISGPRDRIMDSILPHEVLHTVFASHVGVVPRWANEGACSAVETAMARNELRQRGFGRVMPLTTLFRLEEYPRDMTQFYAQSNVLCEFLLEHTGKRGYAIWLAEGARSGAFTVALLRHYGYADVRELEVAWDNWLRVGAPRNRLAAKKWLPGTGWVGGIDEVIADAPKIELFSVKRHKFVD